jgi:hypothetical protein
VLTPQMEVQQGYWSVGLQGVQLVWPNGTTSSPAGACTGLASGASTSGSSSGSSQSQCLGILDSGTAQIIGSIEQVAALNAALGGTPTKSPLPLDCTKEVARVLAATAQALDGPTPSASANQVCVSSGARARASALRAALSAAPAGLCVARCAHSASACAAHMHVQVCGTLYGASAVGSLQAILCSAVQMELFSQQQAQPDAYPAAQLQAAQDRAVATCASQLMYADKVALPCDAIASLPAIRFRAGAATLELPVRDYAYQVRWCVGVAAAVALCMWGQRSCHLEDAAGALALGASLTTLLPFARPVHRSEPQRLPLLLGHHCHRCARAGRVGAGPQAPAQRDQRVRLRSAQQQQEQGRSLAARGHRAAHGG